MNKMVYIDDWQKKLAAKIRKVCVPATANDLLIDWQGPISRAEICALADELDPPKKKPKPGEFVRWSTGRIAKRISFEEYHAKGGGYGNVRDTVYSVLADGMPWSGKERDALPWQPKPGDEVWAEIRDGWRKTNMRRCVDKECAYVTDCTGQYCVARSKLRPLAFPPPEQKPEPRKPQPGEFVVGSTARRYEVITPSEYCQKESIAGLPSAPQNAVFLRDSEGIGTWAYCSSEEGPHAWQPKVGEEVWACHGSRWHRVPVTAISDGRVPVGVTSSAICRRQEAWEVWFEMRDIRPIDFPPEGFCATCGAK